MNGGGEEVLVGVGEHSCCVAAVIVAREFEKALFHGPQAGKGDLGAGRRFDLPHFTVAHHAAGNLGAVVSCGLDVDADRTVTQGDGHRLMAVAHAEVDVGMAFKQGLAAIVMDKYGQFIDAVFQQQGTLKQAVGGYAQPLVTLLAVAQGIVTSLRADRRQCLVKVKSVDILVDIKHRFNSKLMCCPLCRAKMIAASIR